VRPTYVGCHFRGSPSAPQVVLYGDHECRRSQNAYRELERAAQALDLCIAFRHYPRQKLHPHSLVARFQLDRFSPYVLARIGRDVKTGLATGELRETPTLFIDRTAHRGGHNDASLVAALRSAAATAAPNLVMPLASSVFLRPAAACGRPRRGMRRGEPCAS
jgi:hypothetical protein